MRLIREFIRESLSLYKTIKEISQRDFETIIGNLDEDDLPFDDVFDGKLRIAVPFVSENMKDIKKLLEKEGYSVDLQSKRAYKTRQSQKGEQVVEMKLGKALTKAFKDKQREFLAYKQENGEDENLSNLENDLLDLKNAIATYNKEGSGYSIIYSRSPVDVLRMSDFDNIQSCHSVGGSYWQCAIAEAQKGGAIAYLVSSNDLKDIDLDQKEIFSDSDRGTKGINPISRLRIRNFVLPDPGSNAEYELAVPETGVYGLDVPGFDTSVLSWTREKQPEYTEDDIDIDDPYSVMLRGGNYTDTSSSDLLNDFFNTDKFTGYQVSNENKDNSKSQFEIFEEEAEEYYDEYDSNLSNVEVEYSVDGQEQDSYIEWAAYIEFEIPEYEDPEIFDSYYYKMNSAEINSALVGVNSIMNNISRHFEISNYDRVSSRTSRDYKFRIDSIEESTGNPDDFRYFLEWCTKVESLYPELEKAWIEGCLRVFQREIERKTQRL